MKRHVRRLVLDFIGLLFLIIGIIGIFLPILQGIIFILISFYFFSLNSRFFESMLKRFLHRHKKLESIFDKADRFIKKLLIKVRLHDEE